jgi:hypothetical protein
VLAVAGIVWLGHALLFPKQRASIFRWVPVFAALLAVAGANAFSSKQDRHLNEHVLIGVVRDIGREPVSRAVIRDLRGLMPAKVFHSAEPADVNPWLARRARRGSRPNIILIVLESVGAVNLLGPDGLPVAALAPTMAGLARHGVVFDSLYTTYPGTTRSLVTLHTGGRQPTAGEDFESPYRGAMLPRSFSQEGYTTAYFSAERMDGEGSDLFLRQTGFQKYYDFAEDPNSRQARYQIHSWGGRDDYAVGLIEDWIGGADRSKAPFLVEFMTAATRRSPAAIRRRTIAMHSTIRIIRSAC